MLVNFASDVKIEGLDFCPPCSYIVPIVDGARSIGSMLDIVDQNQQQPPTGSAEISLAGRR